MGAKHVTLKTGDDIFSLTREAADVSGIPFVMDVDAAECDKILNG